MNSRIPSTCAIAVLTILGVSGCGDDAAVRVSGAERSGPTVRQEGDVWQGLMAFASGGGLEEAEVYGSLEAMASAADRVVLATPVSIVRTDRVRPLDDQSADAPTAPVSVLRMRVLPGSPDGTAGEFVEVSAFGVELTNDLIPADPDPALVFLRWRSDTGQYRLVSSQGVIADRDGRARLVREEFFLDSTDSASLRSLGHGDPFSSVVERTRRARPITSG